MTTELFDSCLRTIRRERALRSGPALFLFERAFGDVLERLADVRRDFCSALLIGAPEERATEKLYKRSKTVTLVPDEGSLDFEPESFDLIVAAGILDTVDNLPELLLRLRFLLKPDSLLIGFMPGGDTLPRLRQAMRSADTAMGAASPHTHPRIEPAALAQLLVAAGFSMPVIDVDRVRVGYRSLHRLVSDLRAMGATNVLKARSRRPLTRESLAAAEAEFMRDAQNRRAIETFELLHFAGWTPAESAGTGM